MTVFIIYTLNNIKKITPPEGAVMLQVGLEPTTLAL